MQEPEDITQVDVFIGVDIAKADHYACAITATGEHVLARPVPNDEAAISRLIDDASTRGGVALVIDTTSSAAQLLMHTAAQKSIPLAYVTGLVMRRAADLYAGAAKTDPKDATVLADYARRNTDRLHWCEPSDEMLTQLRILNARDTDLAADATKIANRLRDALLTVSPALERAIGSRLTTNRGLREILTRWGSPTELKTAGRARIRRVIAKHSPRTAVKLTDTIWAALNAQTVTITAEAVWADTIRELAADLNSICERRKLLAENIEAVFMAHPLGKIISTMCGFGPRTGARTLAEIGDPHRFNNASRLASYAGLVPINWQSGNKTIARKPRGGNHRLKNAMFTAAFIATQHDPSARAYYQQKRSQGKRHNAAIICVARRRCNIILSMLKTRTPYQQPQPA